MTTQPTRCPDRCCNTAVCTFGPQPDPADLARRVLGPEGNYACFDAAHRSLAREVLRLHDQLDITAEHLDAASDDNQQLRDRLARVEALAAEWEKAETDGADCCDREWDRCRRVTALVLRAALNPSGTIPPPEIRCPSCGATIRARMADQP